MNKKTQTAIAAIFTLSATTSFASERPCDIYEKAGTPCVAAHSLARALFGNYDGNLYQVRRADGTTKDIPVDKAGGYAKSSIQDEFCTGTTCTISIIYDQTSYKNDLKKSPPVFWLKEGGKEAIADKAPAYVNGHKVYGFYRDAWSATGYRNNNTKGVATGDEEESMYMVVDGRHYNNSCCFNYGNAETTGNDDGPGTMECVYFGDDTDWGGPGQGKGPWVAADLEDGVFKGNDAGYMWGKTHTTPWPDALTIDADYATAMLKGPNNGTFVLKGGSAQEGKLNTMWDGPRKQGYSPRKLQGAIVLGNGGDGSDGGAGTFYEGVMTIGCPPDSIDDKVQANIVAARYGSKETRPEPIDTVETSIKDSIPDTVATEIAKDSIPNTTITEPAKDSADTSKSIEIKNQSLLLTLNENISKTYTVFDIQGNKITAFHATNFNSEWNKVQSKLPNGIYVIKTQNKISPSQKTTLIKNKRQLH